MRYLSIRARLAIGLSLLLLFAFVAINVVNYMVSKESLRGGIITETLPSISDNIFSEINNSLLMPTQISSLMANDTFVKDWLLGGEQDVNLITKYLREIKEHYGFDSAFLVSSRTGRYYHYSGLRKYLHPTDLHDIWYYEFMRGNALSDLDVDTDEAAANRLTIFINHRLTGYQGEFLGVTGVGLSLDSIGRFFEHIRQNYGKDVYLVDESGAIQVHSDVSRVGAMNIHEEPGLAQVADQVLSAGEEPLLVEYDGENGHMLLISRFIPEFNWFMVVELHQDPQLAGLKHNLVRNLGIGLLVTLAVIGVNVFMVNHFQGRLEYMAQTDDLTGLHNRRHFMTIGNHDFAQHQRTGKPLALLLLDVDHFKDVNDSHGHEAGDQVLRELARIMRQELREADLLGRMGGEEFLVLMPGASQDNAVQAAERLRRAMPERLCPELKLKITISVGVAMADTATPSLEHLIHKADAALYAAKHEGRNRVNTA